MKIYTRKGDEGKTALLGGARVSKHHMKIEAYGTVDELNSYTGLLRDEISFEDDRKFLLDIQNKLFTIGSHLALEQGKQNIQLPEIVEHDVMVLEDEMDRLNETLPEMKSFVLPGGHRIVSICHIARCICRRAERNTVKLNEEEKTDAVILKYLNRLSDYYFVMARSLAKRLDVQEIPWKPQKK